MGDAEYRLFAKVLRDALSRGRFDSISEVNDAFRQRCRELRIPYDQAAMDRALDVVGTNHCFVEPPKPTRPAPGPRVAEPPASHAEAAAILRSLGVVVRQGRLAR